MKKLDDRLAVAIDYETYYDSKSGYSLTKMTPQQYCSDDRFDAYLVAICGKDIAEETPVEKLSDGRQLYVGRPEKFKDWKKLNGRILLAHNAAFDSVVTDELIKRRLIPALTGCEWKCTADMVAYLACGRSLKTAMKVLYGKEISKEVRSNMDGKHPIQLNEQEIKDLYEYGGSDAVECHDLWLDHCAEWPEIERAISDQNREATKRGVLVDKEYAMTATKELSSYKATIACDVPWYPDKPIGSLPALRAAVLELGIDPPPSFKKDDPRFLEWSEKHSDIPFISARQKAVSVNMHLSRVESIVSSLDADGVTHPQFLYFGAHTGRNSGKSSVGSSNVNMLNMPRKPVLQGDPNVFGGKGVDIRGMYIPRPGHKFAIYDYSQVEARFSLWLAGDTHMIDTIHKEGNLYQAAAVQMGWCQSGCDLKHSNPDLYRLSKAATLGLGYSMGAAKFVDTCKSQGLELDPVPVEQWPELDRRIQFILRNVVQLEGDPYSEENRETVGRLIKSLQIVDDWRKSNTKIVNKWREYADSFKMAITAGWDVISFRLASGRIKRYYNPCLFKEPTVEIGEDGKKHPGFRLAMRAETVRGNPATFFTGGNIMENIVQATCRDIMAYSAVEIERKHPKWKYVFSVYDEIVFEIPEGDAEEASVDIPRIMCHGDLIAEWTDGLPLEVEGDIADRYHK